MSTTYLDASNSIVYINSKSAPSACAAANTNLPSIDDMDDETKDEYMIISLMQEIDEGIERVRIANERFAELIKKIGDKYGY